MTPTVLCLVRHGETVWNAEGRIQGQFDVPLSEVGLAQAEALAAALENERFDAIYSSDLERVRQTAQPVAHRLGLPILLEPGLRERHYGKFQTIGYREAKQLHPEEFARMSARDPEFDFGGTGESLRAFAERIGTTLRAIVARHAGGRVLVLTHGGVLDIAHRLVHGRTLDARRDYELPNAGLNWVEVREDIWTVLAWGITTHLPSVMKTLAD
jgi:probable phosphoglycerate mutase